MSLFHKIGVLLLDKTAMHLLAECDFVAGQLASDFHWYPNFE